MPADSRRPDEHVLAAVIETVGSSLDLERVLAGVVSLLTDASGVHACFVYLVEDGGELLRLRAASSPFGHLTGQIVLTRGEGLAWWALERREPAFIRDNALGDPRFKYVPELSEERFQSLVAVPIVGRADQPIGAIILHSEAPREFTQHEVETLVSSASLVAGAIENARLYEETRRRVHQLEQLTALGETIARAETLDDLLPAVAAAAVELLRASSCAIYVLEPSREELHLYACAPAAAEHRSRIALAELGPELASGGRARPGAIVTPLLAGSELRGLIEVHGDEQRHFDPDDADLARTAASQTAIAIERIELIERLTEKNAIKDVFDDLASGNPRDLSARTKALALDLAAPHLVLAATAPPDAGLDWAGALEAALRRDLPGSLFDQRDGLLLALLPVRSRGVDAVTELVRTNVAATSAPVLAGLSAVCRDRASYVHGFEEARHALLGVGVVRGGSGTLSHDELGPYRYLLRMPLERGSRDPHRAAIERLADYDRQRSTSLVRTLEEFLRRRGSISATSEALFVHQNTLRQRLRRISDLTGIDLRRDDWLAIEIAVKLVAVESTLRSQPPVPRTGQP